MLDEAEEPRLPVVAEIVVDEREPARAAREDADLVAADARVRDPDVVAAVDANGDARRAASGSAPAGAPSSVAPAKSTVMSFPRMTMTAESSDAGAAQPIRLRRDANGLA